MILGEWKYGHVIHVHPFEHLPWHWLLRPNSAKTPPNKAAIGFAAGVGAAASDCEPASRLPNSDLVAMSHIVTAKQSVNGE